MFDQVKHQHRPGSRGGWFSETQCMYVFSYEQVRHCELSYY